MDTEEHKERFATVWATMPDDAFKAALTVYGDAGQALAAVRRLESDPEVIAMRDAKRDEAKEELAASVYDLALETAAQDLRALPTGHPEKTKIIAAILGHAAKVPQVNINNTTNVDNRKVMVVNDHGSDDDWSAKLLAQQAKLVQDADKPATVN